MEAERLLWNALNQHQVRALDCRLHQQVAVLSLLRHEKTLLEKEQLSVDLCPGHAKRILQWMQIVCNVFSVI